MLTEPIEFGATMSAFSSVLSVFFLHEPVIAQGGGRRWDAPYNAGIATGMD